MTQELDDTTAAKVIGEWVREQREKADLSQHDVAHALNLTDGAPAQWENGRAMPRADRLMRLAGLFGLASLAILSAMLGDNGAKAPTTAKARRGGKAP